MSTPDLVTAFYERIWNAGDLRACAELLAPNFAFRGSLGREMRGHGAFRDYVRSVREPLGEYNCQILDCVSEQDHAFARMRFSGIHLGPFRNHPPTGKAVAWHGAALFRFERGQIAELWVLGDLVGLDRVLHDNAVLAEPQRPLLARQALPELSRAVLLIIDVQNAIDAPYHAVEGPRNNPDAERRIAHLLSAWRGLSWPIIHVRHDSTFPTSAYRPDQSGNAFKDEVAPMAGELVVSKQTNSAFIGTELDSRLRQAGADTLVVTGVSTNNSVEATVRMAGNLGFRTCLVADACFTFARRDYAGRLRTADEVHAMSLANLDDEYCTVVSSDLLLRALPR
jgi:steroid delta-isomerase-like uncharacterized protein